MSAACIGRHGVERGGQRWCPCAKCRTAANAARAERRARRGQLQRESAKLYKRQWREQRRKAGLPV